MTIVRDCGRKNSTEKKRKQVSAGVVGRESLKMMSFMGLGSHSKHIHAAPKTDHMSHRVAKFQVGKKKTAEEYDNAFYYAMNDSVAELTLIVDNDPKAVFELDGNGATLLHCAAMNGRTRSMNLVMSRGVDIFAKDKNGSTALHYALLRGMYEQARVLLDKGCHTLINSKNSVGMTIVHDCCYVGRKEGVVLLIEYGGDINIKDNYGRTPLQVYGTKPSDKIGPDQLARWRNEVENEFNRWKEIRAFKAKEKERRQY